MNGYHITMDVEYKEFLLSHPLEAKAARRERFLINIASLIALAVMMAALWAISHYGPSIPFGGRGWHHGVTWWDIIGIIVWIFGLGWLWEEASIWNKRRRLIWEHGESWTRQCMRRSLIWRLAHSKRE